MTSTIQIGGAYVYSQALARYYLTIEQIKEVWLFGSLAIHGDGRDIDLILSVEQELFYAFIDELNLRIAHSPRNITGDMFTNWRSELAQKLIQAPLVPSLLDPIEYSIDLFLFPLGWEENIEKIERLSYTLRKRFVRKIRRDALRFDPILGDFVSSSR